MAGQNVIRGQRILRRPVRTIEGIHPEGVPRDFHRRQNGVRRGDQRRAVMSEVAPVIEIDRGRPANPVQVGNGRLVDRCVLGVTRE